MSQLTRQKVYDPLLRLLHWGLALSVLAMIASSQAAEFFEDGPAEDSIWTLHIYAGYGLTTLLLIRIIWGLVGPRHARFSSFFQPAVWRKALGDRRLPQQAAGQVGHHPSGALAYLGVYLILTMMALTGLIMAGEEHHMGPLAATQLSAPILPGHVAFADSDDDNDAEGALLGARAAGEHHGAAGEEEEEEESELEELAEGPHEFGFYLILAFILTHIGALIYFEHREKRPIAQAMVSGYQYIPQDGADDSA